MYKRQIHFAACTSVSPVTRLALEHGLSEDDTTGICPRRFVARARALGRSLGSVRVAARIDLWRPRASPDFGVRARETFPRLARLAKGFKAHAVARGEIHELEKVVLSNEQRSNVAFDRLHDVQR